jgi:hypothetical protein
MTIGGTAIGAAMSVTSGGTIATTTIVIDGNGGTRLPYARRERTADTVRVRVARRFV